MFGFLNCNKPPGMSSRDVVNVVQRRLRKENPDGQKKGSPKIKVGHCGTLDPLAEGVLVLGVGPAVRLVPFVQQTQKHYVGTFRLGASSETGDLEDGYHQHDDLPTPTTEQLQKACQTLTGRIRQIPPAYSAIWVDGERAYDRVRRGEDFEMPSREVDIHSLKLMRYEFPEIEIDTECGSGTYIRTLGIDLAKTVGSISVMTHLQRVGVGGFRIDDACSVEDLRKAPLNELLRPALDGISHLPQVSLNAGDTQRIQNGLCVEAQPDPMLDDQADVAALTETGQLLAIMRHKSRGWCPYRVFPIA